MTGPGDERSSGDEASADQASAREKTGAQDEASAAGEASAGEASADEASADEVSADEASAGDPALTPADDGPPPLAAARYADGSLTYPPHPVGPDGSEPVETVDLSAYTAVVVTWTTAHAPPPGVRSPNHLAIVEFDVEGTPVRALGQLTTADVEIGDAVEPVYCEELRDPDAGVREPDSQSWDGYRFRPL